MSDEEHFDIDEFVAEANRWDDLYLHSTIHAVELYHDQSQVREIILELSQPQEPRGRRLERF